jgi:hypothetical protein
MRDKQFKLTREDGEELGVFDRQDEAERTADYDARSRGYGLRWTSVFGGKRFGKPTTTGRDVLGYTIRIARRMSL